MIIYVYLAKTTVAVTLRYVGRKHQPELLKRSVAQDCLPFMSRDHFNISFSRGLFHIRTMTSNPIWRFRSGNFPPIELQRGDPVDLQTGTGKGERFESCLCVHMDYLLILHSCDMSPGKNWSIYWDWIGIARILLIQFFASLVCQGIELLLALATSGTLRWSSYARSGNPWRLKSQH